MKKNICTKNELFISIASLHTTQEINRIMDRMFIQSEELFEKLIAAEGCFEIEKDGFFFVDKKVAPKNGTADFLEFYFYKEIEAWIGDPDNKVQAIQYDFVQIEKKSGNKTKRIIPHIREPFIILKDIEVSAQMGKVKVASQMDFEFRVRVDKASITFDLEEFFKKARIAEEKLVANLVI